MSAVVARAEILPPFDYAALTPEQADLARNATAYIDARHKGMASSMLEIGQKLNEVKASLGHGNFTSWLAASFTMTNRTAQHYMQAASAVGSKSETVSYLPVSTVYEIARAPEPIRQKVIQEIEAAPSPVPAKNVTNIIWQAQEAAKNEARLAKFSPAQRKRDKARKAEDRAKQEAHHLKLLQGMAKSERAVVKLAELLVDRFGDDIAEIATLLSSIDSTTVDLARRITGNLYGTGVRNFQQYPLSKSEWLEHLADLDRGEIPGR